MEAVSTLRDAEWLAAFITRYRRLLVITGAGCSTNSGIPAYRDATGAWQRQRPVQYQDFIGNGLVRQRYWARSMSGWPVVNRAAPNRAHIALARLEQSGMLHWLITQNVDGLHQRAGSTRITDLHGRLDRVLCLDCGALVSRADLQLELEALNPDWRTSEVAAAPDGDADLEADFRRFRVPACACCGGMLKPDVVFFGENVPRERVAHAFAQLEQADAVLVVGSSLMVWSGLRFVRAAVAVGLPVVAVNRGYTRADADLSAKIEGCCEAILDEAVRLLN